jgi:PAS domain S-box-containing protein
VTKRSRSARQLAEEALDQSQRQYRDLVEHSLGLICAHDFTGRLLFVNPAAAKSLGYEPGEGAGANLRDFLAPSARVLFDAYLERIRRDRVDAGLMRLRTKDGRERVWMYRNILYDEGPESPRILGHAVDITERVEAERALRRSQDALSHTLAELDTRVRDRTSELQAVLVRERENLAFWTTVNTQLGAVLEYDATLQKVAALPVPFLAEWSLLHVPHESGTHRCVAGRHVDPARQPSLNALALEAPTLLSADSSVASVLRTGQRETIARDPDVVTVRLFGPGGHVELIRALGAESLVVVPLSVGDHVVAALSLVATTPGRFADADKAMLDDVARRFAVAIDRARLYREAQEANRLKDEFLATLSHELRTPLNAILGWSRILRARQLDKRTGRAAEIIDRNADNLARLVEDLLDVSRVITGKLTLNERPVDLSRVLGAALDSIRPAARAKQIQLVREVEADAQVIGDEHRLQQVFWNLLSNAVKFTPSGGTVTLSLRQSGNAVTTRVTDTGVGIRKDVLPFVFDRFRQADASSTRLYGGLGLGLAIVRHIVELHGGMVKVQSVEGEGATFVVELPTLTAATGGPDFETSRSIGDASSDAQDDVGDPRTPRVPLRGARVLIVDDDPDARDLVAEIIRAAGAVVVTAASSREALESMRSFEPQALISDIGLPHEDGYELIRQVRQLSMTEGARPVAIALTGYARAEDRTRALEAGYQEHVAKPVEPRTLVRIVREILDAQKVERSS